MSLINEALKKVQNQQGTAGPTLPPGPPVTPHPPHAAPQDKGKHRSFVWGFVVAVLIIGLVTTLLATFFVWQILGTEEPAQVTDPAIVQKSPVEEPVSEPRTPSAAEPQPSPVASPEAAPAIPAPASPPVAAIPETTEPSPIANPAPSAIDPPEPSSTPPAQAVDSQQAPVSVAQIPPVPEKTIAQPATPSLPKPPDPAVVSRLQEVQIRGIMSGGIKVLIHDESTGQTRAYRVGENLEGTMGLEVVGITPNTIQFRDYAGSIHSKSF